jgi:hypothetical protein
MDETGCSGKLPEPDVFDSVKDVAFDEMWHFVNKKRNY